MRALALVLAFMPLSGIAQGSLQSEVAVIAKDAKAIAVFITDSRAEENTREAVIARIARVVYKEAILTK